METTGGPDIKRNALQEFEFWVLYFKLDEKEILFQGPGKGTVTRVYIRPQQSLVSATFMKGLPTHLQPFNHCNSLAFDQLIYSMTLLPTPLWRQRKNFKCRKCGKFIRTLRTKRLIEPTRDQWKHKIHLWTNFHMLHVSNVVRWVTCRCRNSSAGMKAKLYSGTNPKKCENIMGRTKQVQRC